MKNNCCFTAVLCLAGAFAPAMLPAGTSKDSGVKAPKEQKESNNGDWCAWLQDDPGMLYENIENPWVQSFEIGGRFHYQAVRLEGTDVNGLDFDDSYDEYRRFRLETKTKFLRYFTAELNVNMVSDDRFRPISDNDLEWGYDRFDEVSLEFNMGKAFGAGILDGIKLKYGRMKLKMTEEGHMSSKEIYTIERSSIADRLGGEASRPTGVTLELDKGDWELVLGVFSAEDDSEFLAAWNDGEFYYGCLKWKPRDDFKLLLDYSLNDQDGRDDALAYDWAAALSAVYETKRWGVIAEGILGDNGAGITAPDPRRQGDFHAFVVMPWVWIVEDKLQAVVQYQYASSEKSQGLQLPSRYVRGRHENPAVDVDNGRGNEHHYLYGGLNYHLCRDRVKIMGGVAYNDLTTWESDLQTLTYQIAFRAAF